MGVGIKVISASGGKPGAECPDHQHAGSVISTNHRPAQYAMIGAAEAPGLAAFLGEGLDHAS